MVTLKVRRIVYEDVEVEPGDLMTMKDAADRLGLSIQPVIAMVQRGRLTELLDEQPLHPFKNRRFVLRREVEEEAARREARALKWEGNGDE